MRYQDPIIIDGKYQYTIERLKEVAYMLKNEQRDENYTPGSALDQLREILAKCKRDEL